MHNGMPLAHFHVNYYMGAPSAKIEKWGIFYLNNLLKSVKISKNEAITPSVYMSRIVVICEFSKSDPQNFPDVQVGPWEKGLPPKGGGLRSI